MQTRTKRTICRILGLALFLFLIMAQASAITVDTLRAAEARDDTGDAAE